ncbi:cupin [Teredinibacter turnerae]|uniref:cupin n=1 Tax=Teredinibacter turnerae TaxID=2426 RepID=UPI000A784DF8|nr:cupin [Teredinibacter turnerae]
MTVELLTNLAVKNVLADVPTSLPDEVFQDLIRSENLRVERILSRGHRSPADGWYDQDENEWVLVLQGSARLAFCTGSDETIERSISLQVGDSLLIPAHQKHRVSWTDPNETTIWLAIFYRA